MSKNTRNDKETNNIKLTNFFQSLATANDIEDTIDEVSNTTFHQAVNEKNYRIIVISEQPVENKEKQP